MRCAVLVACLVIAEGCAARRPPTVAPRPTSPSAKPVKFVATAYCQRGTTATGDAARRGIVAADPAVLPLGSRIQIESAGRHDGIYRVSDTGQAVRGHRIDLFIADCREARKFGRRTIHVKLLDPAHVE